MKNSNSLKIFYFLSFLNICLNLGALSLANQILTQTLANAQISSICVLAFVFLPFVLTLSPAGILADFCPKILIMKISVLFNVFLSLALCCFANFLNLALVLSFILAFQGAFFSPAKYGFIKEFTGQNSLILTNSILNALSVVAILAFYFSLSLNLTQNNDAQHSALFFSVLLVILAFLEFFLVRKLPKFKADKELKFSLKDYLKFKLFTSNFNLVLKDKSLKLCVLLLALFCFGFGILLGNFVFFAEKVLLKDSFFTQICALFLGFGLIFGFFILARISKNYLELGFIPLGILGVFLFSLLIFCFSNLAILALLFFFLGLCAAFFFTTLNALLQFQAKENKFGRVLAVSNFIKNLAFLIALALTVFAFYLEFSAFYLASLVLFIAVFLVFLKLPYSLIRILLQLAFFQRYKLLVEGFENIPQRGGALILGNHSSFIDWAIIQMAVPRKVHFILQKSIYSKWYIQFFLDKFETIFIKTNPNEEEFKRIANLIANGELVCLFPESVISKHGQLNEFRDDFERICALLKEGLILPFYIRGLWGSAFSRSDEEFSSRHRKFSKRNIAVAFGKAMPLSTKKTELKARIFELSFMAWKSQCEAMQTITRSFINSVKRKPSNIALIDPSAGAISYRKMLSLSLILSKFIKKNSQNMSFQRGSYAPKEECVGILLPSSFASALCNLATLFANKVVVNLNFTAEKNLYKALKNANIKQIYTSKLFLEKLENKGIKFKFDSEISVIFMEDLAKLFKQQKIKILSLMILVSILPSFALKALFSPSKNNLAIAAILFSSGSEASPKGIMLNNRNILSNIAQISDVLCAKDNDIILSSLPPFHAFGLTVTSFLPLLENIKSVTFPNPSDALGIAKIVSQNKVSIMCATSSFLGIYARNSRLNALMFESLRIVVSGAEKLKNEVRTAFESKFKKSIFEGYGATETTPVISVNLPDKFDAEHWILQRASKEGSVGMPLPGTAVRIVNSNTYESLKHGEQGLVLVGGHQVMVGYLNDKEKTDEVIKELDKIRWYNTGDKGYLDNEGFLYIIDRYSRFAKIGGEMISLSALENELSKFLNTELLHFCALSLDDEKKGEKIALLLECKEEHFKDIVEAIKFSKLPPLFKPSLYIKVEKIPLLGSGKVDFQKAKELALENS